MTTLERLNETVGNEHISDLCDLLAKCGKLISAARLVDFASTYPKSVENQSSRWIKTPCVVISRAEGEALGIEGGHNVDATVTRFEISQDSTVKPGTVQLTAKNGTNVIVVNANDAAKVPGQVRLAAARFKTIEEMQIRNEGEPLIAEKVDSLKKQAISDLEAAIKKSRLPSPRTQVAALKLREWQNPSNRGAVPPNTSDLGASAVWPHGMWSDFHSAPESLRNLSAQLREAGMPTVIAARQSDGSIELLTTSGQHMRAGNSQSAIDFCSNALLGMDKDAASTLRVNFEGFSADENIAMLSSIRVRTKANLEGQYEISLKGGRTMRNFNDSLIKDFDLKNATLTLDAGSSEVKGVLEIPLLSGKGRAKMTVIARAKNATHEMLRRLLEVIRDIIATFKLKGDFGRDAVSQLRADIHKKAKDLGLDAADVQIQFQSEMGDFYIVSLPNESQRDMLFSVR